jgi:hypothetical protein
MYNKNNKIHESGFVKNDAFVTVATQTLSTLEMEIAPCFRILTVKGRPKYEEE